MADDILNIIDDIDDDTDELYEDDDMVYEGEIVDSSEIVKNEMGTDEAQKITNAIKSSVTATYLLIAEAHERKAHKALGYDTWAEYVRDEFDISSSRSYQLLDLSKTIKEIESVTPDGTKIKLTEAQARDIKRELPRITEQVEEETRDLEPEEASDRVAEIIDDIRDQQKEDQKALDEKQQAWEAAAEENYNKGIEDASTALLEADAANNMGDNADSGFMEMEVEGSGESLNPQAAMDLYNFFSMLTSLTSLPDPEDILENIPEERYEEVNNQLEEGTSWLNRFQTLWEFKDN